MNAPINMENSTVEILLSTYNGEKYVNAQLDSVLQQDYPHWKLVIRDDGSTDGTLSVLNNYNQKYPGKINLVTDNEGTLGYCASFSKLLKQASADYIMFCDQDDWWFPSKISTMLSVMLEEETLLPATSHVIFSDLQLADNELNIISPSFLKRMGYSPKAGMQIFFLKNYIPGCNIMFNRNLVQEALKTDNIMNLHDHWVLMVCGAVGKLTFINNPLMKYRMHDNNAIGFLEPGTSFLSKMSLFFKDNLKYGFSNYNYRNLRYSKNIKQMQNICEHLGADVSKDAIEFSSIDGTGYIARKIKNIIMPYILENSILKQLTYIICF
jgi:glycosyltransferase involved in cell wall biosynthesis